MSYRCTARLEKKLRIRRGEGLTRSEPDWFYLIDKKRPSQIEHRIGKSWIYVLNYLRAVLSGGREKIIYFKDEETRYKTEFGLQPDNYTVIEQGEARYEYIFGEYQDIGNAWNKNYSPVLASLSSKVNVTLIVVTSDPNPLLEKRLRKEFEQFPYVSLKVYSLNQLRDFIWRIVTKQRQELLEKGVM